MHVRIPLLLLLGASAFAQAPAVAAPTQSTSPVPPKAMGTIHQKELLAHATFLASDELKGRLTGSPGQLAAADYIAAHFAKLGLEPLGDEVDGKPGFRQSYGISRTYVAADTKLQLGGLTLTEGFAVLGGKPSAADVDGTLQFCGLGRTRGDNADVGDGVDLTGKIAVVAVRPLRGEVKKDLSVEQKFMMSFSTYGSLGKTAVAIAKKNAAAVLFVLLEDKNGLQDTLNYLAVAPGKDSLTATFQGADPGMGAIGQAIGGGDSGVPTLVLSVPASAQLLGELGLEVGAVAAFVKGEGDRPVAKDDVVAKGRIVVANDPDATACNVVAVLRGSDPALAGEAIVYSAHMDHVGTRIDGEIFNGADDNASGTSGLLAIASAFAKSETKPRRSVIFLSVSGEELGLWGSAFYADNPTWPADAIVANVNTDMIGRNGPESGPTEVMVTPSNRHAKFSTMVQDSARFAEVLGCTFTSGDKYWSRSDHYNFAKKGIPVIFFCNGEHEDYHQVTDHADKLDGEKMERMSRLAFWTGWNVADSSERPRTLGKREGWR